ncbi:TPA: hypothetical protein EYP44_03570 [Candidatus Bathyarchaeota archaeon]|nr:hypothetical protein [Candidatus Bathyarchaeota archaeon]
MARYRFIGRWCRQANPPFRIPYGAVVELVKRWPKRRVAVRYKGEVIVTRGTLLRKIQREMIADRR